ncbi:MAG: patatin-like phospholipase family protein [Kosmotoga sp.]|nr:MAG: patatin-like phospholipase family protein [Kosmotoga sp.]
MKKPKTALILSGGGARGAAHIGVIRALEETGFKPDMIIGVSIGSVIGACYALLNDANSLWSYTRKAYYLGLKWFPFKLPITSRPYCRFLANLGCSYMNNRNGALPSWLYFWIFRLFFRKLTFNDTRIKFLCISTDLKTGERYVHSEGLIYYALKASMAMPGVFPPIKFKGKELIDGGTISNLPADIAKSLGAERIIAVDVSESDKEFTFPKNSNMQLVMIDHMIFEQLSEYWEKDVHLLIRPKIGDIDALEFSKTLKIAEKGYTSTKRLLESKRVSL